MRTRRTRRTGHRPWRDDRNLGYATVTGLERFLGSFSPPFVLVNGLLLMALIGLVDAVTGPFAVSVFYLVPIGLVTYARGRWVGTLMAAAAAAAWSGVELALHVTDWSMPITYWNWLTRFYVYEVVVLLVAPLRDVAAREREVAFREIEAADKLRALSSIRDSLLAEGGHIDRLEALAQLQRAETEAEISSL